MAPRAVVALQRNSSLRLLPAVASALVNAGLEIRIAFAGSPVDDEAVDDVATVDPEAEVLVTDVRRLAHSPTRPRHVVYLASTAQESVRGLSIDDELRDGRTVLTIPRRPPTRAQLERAVSDSLDRAGIATSQPRVLDELRRLFETSAPSDRVAALREILLAEGFRVRPLSEAESEIFQLIARGELRNGDFWQNLTLLVAADPSVFHLAGEVSVREAASLISRRMLGPELLADAPLHLLIVGSGEEVRRASQVFRRSRLGTPGQIQVDSWDASDVARRLVANGAAVHALAGERNRPSFYASSRTSEPREDENNWQVVARYIAHQVGNPVSTLSEDGRMLSESLGLIEQKYPQLVGDDDLMLAKKIADRGGRLLSQASKVLAVMSQYRRGGQVDRDEVPASSVLGPAVEHLLSSGASCDVAIPDHLAVLCNETMISQVFSELATNSLKAYKHETSEEPLIVRISCRALGARNIEYLYEDNAGGIPQSLKAKVFQPDFTTGGGGRGWGLALARFFVERSNLGRISEDGVPGVGARFRVVLPRVLEDDR